VKITITHFAKVEKETVPMDLSMSFGL
jgi:hypothetical protein